MLVLSRKNRESVVVGGSDSFHRLLKVTVLGINGTNVKLGFEVDPDVPVHRSEVWERINGNSRAGSLTKDAAAPLAGCLEPARQQGRADALPDAVKTNGGDRASTTTHDGDAGVWRN